MTDPISDLLIRIKNAAQTGKKHASVSYSKIMLNLLEVLEKEGFVEKISQKGKKPGDRSIEFEISYDGSKPKVKGTERVSKFSRRVYLKNKDIAAVRKGFGRVILTTPKGVMADREAIKENIGGEALFRIW